MPGFEGKTRRAFCSWLALGLACLAFVSCRAEGTSHETRFGDAEMEDNQLDDVPLEALRDALVEEFLDDLTERALRMYGGRKPFDSNLINLSAGWRMQPRGPEKRGRGGFGDSYRLTNLASGFHKRVTSGEDDGGQWGAYAEDKRGRGMFGNRLTNLKSGFTKKSEATEDKRGGSTFSGRLTNLASGFTKRSDEGPGVFDEDKRGRRLFSGASRLTNLASGFKRSDGEGRWEEEDKRGRSTSFAGSSRLTNLASGFKRDGNFNVGPMVHIPSGFAEKRSGGADDSDSL